MTKIIAGANQKGGVGKTSTILGLASAASKAGVRTLVIDMDPQANATACMGVDPSDSDYTINDVLYADTEGAAEAAIVSTDWEHVDIIPSSLALEARGTDLDPDAVFRLETALKFSKLKQYDLVLIDCQPSIGRLVYTALIAADELIIVTEPSVNASDGVKNMLTTVEKVRRRLNPRLQLAGIVINKVPANTKESQFRLEELRQALSADIIEPPLPFRAIVSEAQGARMPIHSYGYRSSEIASLFDQYLKNIMEQ